MVVKILFVLLILSITIPFGAYFIGKREQSNFKMSLLTNVISFFGILVFSTVYMFSTSALAAETTATAASSVQGMAYLAAALVTGLCTIGTGIATGQAAAAALGALSENEKIMGKALIFVALAEGIAIYGLLISFTILGRV
ncbi:ATP synthase subunit C [Anaeropeptidivorans aminofermentans]|jgi:V/A-type H+-transporting ATPase subunit K|uniref:ATP synthase subunit C n=1 Tax=Anaeropeptidivorans aminofermentans TaxID=2934315 RepID=UPI002024C53F|nr:ATP synthase subunit C [Anaeropeptidivorans aminofermentans]MBE6012183.1 ATPase [Lachnospiraceae bacterium]